MIKAEEHRITARSHRAAADQHQRNGEAALLQVAILTALASGRVDASPAEVAHAHAAHEYRLAALAYIRAAGAPGGTTDDSREALRCTREAHDCALVAETLCPTADVGGAA